MTYRLSGMAVLAIHLAAHPAAAEKIALHAMLSPRNEVPPIDSPASGMAELALDTASRELSWTISFEKLTGPVRAAHFHGAASPSQNAGILLPLGGAEATSPLKGSRALTAEQMAELLAGRWYINIHTNTHRPGEIRGQIVRR